MPKNGCGRIKALFMTALDDELNAAQKQELESHLKSCALCRAEFDNLNVLSDGLLSLPELELPEGYHDTLMQRINSGGSRRVFRIYGSVAASVAVVFIALAALVFTADRRISDSHPSVGSGAPLYRENVGAGERLNKETEDIQENDPQAFALFGDDIYIDETTAEDELLEEITEEESAQDTDAIITEGGQAAGSIDNQDEAEASTADVASKNAHVNQAGHDYASVNVTLKSGDIESDVLLLKSLGENEAVKVAENEWRITLQIKCEDYEFVIDKIKACGEAVVTGEEARLTEAPTDYMTIIITVKQ